MKYKVTNYFGSITLIFWDRELNRGLIAYLLCYDKTIVELKAAFKLYSDYRTQLNNVLIDTVDSIQKLPG